MSERRFFDDTSDGHSDIRTNLHGTRKAKFSGTVERNQYKQNKENENIINRKKAVREQEDQKAKRNTKEGREQERLDQEKQFEEEKLRRYIAVQEEIRKMEEAKRLAEIESGQAHRNAEISVKLREDRERHRREEDQQNSLAAADRGKKAIATQRDLEEQLNGPRRKYLENRDKVMEQEFDRAHKLAAEFREKERDRSEEREDYTPYDNFNKNISKGVYKKKAVGDFSKSHIHNSIVVSHDAEGQISAFDAARREEERTTARREEFRASKDDVRMKSLERWQSATQKDKEKKMAKDLEDQMQRLQKAKNLHKIEEGKKYPEQQIKPATKLQIQNRNQKLAEKEFEDMFMGKRPNSEGTLNNKGKKTTTRPPFKAPTQPPARPHPLVEQSTLLSGGGFDNTTNRTNEFQEQDHEESEEEEEQPRSTTGIKESSYREEDTRGVQRQPDSPPKYPDHEEEDEEEEEEEEELASSKKYHNESSYSHASRSGYDQTSEEPSRHGGLMSFGDRQRQQQANAVGKSPELSSYQQESTSQYERDNHLGQSQSSGLSDSRYQRREEEQQQDRSKQRRAMDNDINNYISEQEAFLQNLENHRKKLNDKLRTTTQENLPNEQPKRAAQHERQPAHVNKSSLNSTSKTVAAQEDEAIEDLQKRAESLLSRFMQPAKEEEDDQEEEDSLEYSPGKYGVGHGLGLGDTKTTQNNYNEQTQSYAYSQDDLEEEKEYSPEKSHQKRSRGANNRDESESELDYSMSDRGERSEKKSKGPAKVDYAVSFGTKQFVPPTETFGKTRNPFEEESKKSVKQAAPDKKAWKMDFDMADDQKVAPQTRSKPEQRERPSTSSNNNNNKQGALVEDEAQGGPSLAELFQKNRKKMMEKYEQHQKEHHEKPEVKEAKPVRTKEEILKQRKAMMDYKAPLSVKAKEQNQAEREAREATNDPFKKSKKSKSKEPKPELLDRLAFGKKASVDKKEMLKLTNKNYELLPEVKKKKEEEKKKEEQRLRRENAKKLDKEIRSKLMK